MASQPLPVQAFYPQALATPGLPPQGMVANPAFYGSPAVAGAQQTAAGGAPYAVWPGGQTVVYSGTPAGAFYQPAVYPVPVPGTDGAPAPLALPTGPAAASPATATPATDASAAAAANSQAVVPATAIAGKPADGQLAASPALMAPGIAGHQPILAGQPQPILPPEYWAQATALTAQAQGALVQPGTGLVQQNLAAVANAVAVASGQPAEMYPLDEREIKRQRRKQSNRESARRSRLRKQAECEDLNKKVDELADENVTQQSQLEQMKALCEKYEAQNNSLQARLGPRASNGESAEVGKFHSTTAPFTPDMSTAGG